MIITETYATQLKQMHNQPEKKLGFGEEPPAKLLEILQNTNYESILDFGCGKGIIRSNVQSLFPSKTVLGYDPGVDQFSVYPANIDFIYSVDTLEHIEPDFLNHVLLNLLNDSKHQYHLIACHPAKKNLPDGRNCHLIIEEPSWWIEKIKSVIDETADILYTNSYQVITKHGKINTYCEIEIKRKL